MHNDEWTERAVMGWKSELGKADALMAARDVAGLQHFHSYVVSGFSRTVTVRLKPDTTYNGRSDQRDVSIEWS